MPDLRLIYVKSVPAFARAHADAARLFHLAGHEGWIGCPSQACADRHVAVLAYLGAELVGVAAGKPVHSGCWMELLFVARRHRRKGYGGRLTAALMRFAERIGCAWFSFARRRRNGMILDRIARDLGIARGRFTYLRRFGAAP